MLVDPHWLTAFGVILHVTASSASNMKCTSFKIYPFNRFKPQVHGFLFHILLYRQFIISKSGSHLDSLSTTQSLQYLESRMDFVIHILTQLRSFTGFNGFGWSIWFTPGHLIDNTIVAMVWVTHGFRCSNHEMWVIMWVRHAFSSSILTIGQLLPKVIDAMSHFGVSLTKLWGTNAVCRTVRWPPPCNCSC